jgi:hypothetical protein
LVVLVYLLCRRGEILLHWDLNIGRGNRSFV